MRRRDFIAGLAVVAGGALLPPRVATAAAMPAYPNLIGRLRHHVTTREDTLIDLAQRYGVGYTELIAANQGVDPWVPGAGVRLVIPDRHILPLAPREGLVINLADQRLYHFRPENGFVDSAPIGIGSVGWKTPIGRTKVVRKRINPTWYVPKSIRAAQPGMPAVVPPGPSNPLGKFALDLDWPSYLIHGTNAPAGVGRRVSHGCIRMYPEDIVRIFERVAIGTPVTVVDQQAKIGRIGDALMLEVHPSLTQADQLEATGKFESEEPPELEYRLIEAAGGDAGRLDWPAVRRAVRRRTGLPTDVLRSSPSARSAG